MNDDLEAMDGLCAKIIEQRDRIEALEDALREIEHECWRVFPREETLMKRLASIAYAALAPEQDTGIGCGKSVIEPWGAPEQKK